MFFGSFIHALGGTLFEIGIPLLCAGYFYLRKDFIGAGFGLWWLSTAFWGVSIYARDARIQILPLLGGDSVGHDWAYLLGTLNVLQYDQYVATIFAILSIFSCVCAHILLYEVMKERCQVFSRE